jgi:hypothetical protein
MPPLLDEDETLRAQAYHNYGPEDFGMEEWEWDELYQDQNEIDADEQQDADDQGEEDDESDSDAEQYLADPSTWTDDDEPGLANIGEEEDDEEAETIVAAQWLAGN